MWDFLQEINAAGTTIILTTHYLEEAESLCRNIAIIDHGRIIQNSTMKALLAKLNVETFILDLDRDVQVPPTLEGYDVNLRDAHTLEVDVEKSRGLNPLFEQLTAQGYTILSMRNKANRLEELFVSLVDKNL
jgi:ABC-2 type transport system ATP-binding protein